jgi:ankyrin repeat protein
VQNGFSLGHYLVDTDDDTLLPVYHIDGLRAVLADARSKSNLDIRDREVIFKSDSINQIVSFCDQDGGTMLSWAVCQRNYPAVQLLLEAGSNIYTLHNVLIVWLWST